MTSLFPARWSVLLAFLVPAAGSQAAEGKPAGPRHQVTVSAVRRVFNNGEHNAFTDLVRFLGRFYSSHERDASGQEITAIYLAELTVEQ